MAKAYMALAVAELVQNRPEGAIQQYEALKKIGETGASLAAFGLADVALFEGRSADAVAILTEAIAADLSANHRSAAAVKLATLADVHRMRGENALALAAADRAVAASTDDSVLIQVARVDLALQQTAKAQTIIKQLDGRLEAEPRAYAKLLEGEIDLAAHRVTPAIDKIREAQKLADTWLGRLALGRAYLESKAYAQASSEFDACISRRGEATAVFLDDIPTYHVLPQVYYYLGLAADGLQSPGAAEWYRTFLSIKKKDDKDPMVVEAKRKVGN
jgi:tetratricopeptide (TPR) repeat protein